jgi:hypothetical protein
MNGHTCGPDCKAHNKCGPGCRCSHHQAVPILITLMAILFLLGAQGGVSQYAVNNIWPMLLGLIGVVKLLGNDCRCC